jgi:hypothetical protein
MSVQVASGWEAKFSNWRGKASETEEDKYKRTCRAIGDALRSGDRLSKYEFTVYAKGSYPNFTNVVADSDVDIAVELKTFFGNQFVHSAKGLTLSDVGVTPYTGDATLAGFKDDVQRALVAYFGADLVERGNKAIRVVENGGRLPADVVPCVAERTWTSQGRYNEGVRLQSDSDPALQIVNYPQQHLDEGTRKNDRTSRRYKRVVRILKRLENEMAKTGVIDVVPSFLIESSVWNVPNDKFEVDSWVDRVRNALAHIYNGTLTDDCVASDDWLEANGIKYLFHGSQGWSHGDAHNFADKAWDHIGFD